MNSGAIEIRPAKKDDWAQMWPIFRGIIDRGDVYIGSSMDRDEAAVIWFADNVHPYVATSAETGIIAAYYLKPNLPGRGSHVANATYMVDERQRGKGVGRMLGEHSLKTAAELGFKAIQFNCVVQTNEAAVKLWKSLGFNVIGTIPKAFRHQQLGLVDALIMHRFVE